MLAAFQLVGCSCQLGAADLFDTTEEALWNEEDPSAYNPSASRFHWFIALMTLSVPSFTTILQQLGASPSLVSTHNLLSGVMGPLPDNQWQLEVMHWWAT